MTTTFSCNAQAIVTQALLQQGWLDYTATADATKTAQMLQALSIMVKAWSSRGLKLWCIENVLMPLTADLSFYSIGPTGDIVTDRPLRIEQAFIRATATDNDIPMTAMSRNEYELLGNKSSTGTPTQFFYDPQLTNGVIHLYPTPSAEVASTYVIRLFIRRNIADMALISSAMDFPQEWYQALYWGLAAETSLMNQVPPRVADRIELKANKFLEEMEDWDREWTSVTFGLDRAAECSE